MICRRRDRYGAVGGGSYGGAAPVNRGGGGLSVAEHLEVVKMVTKEEDGGRVDVNLSLRVASLCCLPLTWLRL